MLQKQSGQPMASSTPENSPHHGMPSQGTAEEKPVLWREWTHEFISALTMIPVVWVLSKAFGFNAGDIELFVVPAVLGWFVAKGYKNKSIFWPLKLPFWKYAPRFALAAAMLVGPPWLFLLSIQGLVDLANAQSVPRLAIAGLGLILFALATALVRQIETLLKEVAGLVGLTAPSARDRIRLATLWIVSIAIIGLAFRESAPDFARICDFAMNQVRKDNFVSFPGEMAEDSVWTCKVKRKGSIYVATVGAKESSNVFLVKLNMNATGERLSNRTFQLPTPKKGDFDD